MSIQNYTGKEIFGTGFFNDFITRLNTELSNYMKINGSEITTILNNINVKNSSQDTSISANATGLSSQVIALNTERSRIDTLNTNYSNLDIAHSDLVNTVDSLSTALSSSNTKIASLELKMTSAESGITGLEGRVTNLESAASDVTASINSAVSAATAPLVDDIADLFAEMTNATNLNTPNVLVRRNADGNFDGNEIKAVRFVSNLTSFSTAASHYWAMNTSDGVLRPKTLANVISEIVLANDVLTKLKTVDGSTSGLDADMIDGLHLRINAGLLEVSTDGVTWTKVAMSASDLLTAIKTVDGSASGLDSDTVDGLHLRINSGLLETSVDGTTWVKAAMSASDLLTAIKTVDGSGSGLDADVLRNMVPTASSTGSTIVQRDADGNTAVKTITAETKAIIGAWQLIPNTETETLDFIAL